MGDVRRRCRPSPPAACRLLLAPYHPDARPLLMFSGQLARRHRIMRAPPTLYPRPRSAPVRHRGLYIILHMEGNLCASALSILLASQPTSSGRNHAIPRPTRQLLTTTAPACSCSRNRSPAMTCKEPAPARRGTLSRATQPNVQFLQIGV